MRFQRSSGILLHPTSLPGKYGIGDLGEAAYRFVDFLVESGQSLWQVLPLGPTGFGDSPYQSLSVFAGNPLLISLEKLTDDGLLPPSYLNDAPQFSNDYVEYGRVIEFKTNALRDAFQHFNLTDDYLAFCEQAKFWLDDYAVYQSIKWDHSGKEWTRWDKYLKRRDANMMQYYPTLHADVIDLHKFQQYIFFKQWGELRDYAHEKGIKIIGDIPIFAAQDSADTWSNRDLFYIYETGDPVFVAGVPPDYFSSTGQLWGNPLYRWDNIKKDGYEWWIDRIRWSLRTVDIIRLDHFRGFQQFWAVPGNATNAINGRWEPGPGEDLFNAIHNAIGETPIIAEDLGHITPEVIQLRNSLGFPGMYVLQFAFNDFPPLPIIENSVVYTGTHDNDTIIGWFNDERNNEQREYFLEHLGSDGLEINWVFIEYAMKSEGHSVIVPLQDILGLGSEGRMNTPASNNGNWSWRFKFDQLTTEIRSRLKNLSISTQRY